MPFFGLYGTISALASTQTLAAAPNCVGIGLLAIGSVIWSIADKLVR